MDINPKVHAAAATATVGGGTAAVLLIWVMQDLMGIPEAKFTPDRVAALTGALAWAGGYIGGYLKSQ
jgi:hypothetical protein